MLSRNGETAAERQAAGPFGAAARAYATAGFRVFPLVPNAKVPLTAHGCKDATTDLALIDAWWSAEPNAGIGIATGEDLVVVDLDVKDGKDGIAEWARLCTEHGTDTDTPLMAKTCSGGQHLYFRGDTIRNSVGRQTTGIGPGIDIRGVGGYVVAAPSVVDGKKYEWLCGSAEIASGRLPPLPALPAWVVEACKVKVAETRTAGDYVEDQPQAITLAGHYMATHETPVEGEGSDHACYQAIGRMWDWGLSDETILDLMGQWTGFDQEWLQDKLDHVETYAQNERGCDAPEPIEVTFGPLLRRLKAEAILAANPGNTTLQGLAAGLQPDPARPVFAVAAGQDFLNLEDDGFDYEADERRMDDAVENIILMADIEGLKTDFSEGQGINPEQSPAEPAAIEDFVENPGAGKLSFKDAMQQLGLDISTPEHRRAPEPPRMLSFDALMSSTFAPAQYLWDGWILAREVNLIYGDGKTGKTMLSLHLAIARAAGIALFGHSVQQGGCLIVTTEDGFGPVKEAVLHICRGLGVEPRGLPISFICRPRIDTTLADIADSGLWTPGQFLRTVYEDIETLTALHGELLVVFDPVVNIATLDENRRHPPHTLCQTVLPGFCEYLGATVVVDAHPSATQMKTGRGGSGSTGWRNATRNMLLLEKDDPVDEHDPGRTLRSGGSNYGPPDRLHLNLNGPVFSINRDWTAPHATTAPERAAAYLREKLFDCPEGINRQDLIDEARDAHGIHPAAIDRAWKELREAGSTEARRTLGSEHSEWRWHWIEQPAANTDDLDQDIPF